jgi:carbamoylphosphate synthase large subunit
MKALVIAGGMPQITLIEELKSRGIATVLVDGAPNPLAKPHADKFFQINVFDIEGVKKIAREEHVDFAITVCADQVLLVVAQVAEELGLPWYIDHATATLVSDKALMKRIFVEHGIPTSRHVVLSALNESAVAHLRYPLIVKPVDAYSSKGVKKVRTPEELPAAFREALAVGRSPNVIVEEFFEGEEISVDLFVQDGRAHVLCISNSDKVRDDDHFAIFRGKVPVHASEALKAEVAAVSQRIAEVCKLENGPMLVQMLTDGTRLSVLEFCARTGGAMKWLLVRRASGIDVIKAVVDLTLGLRPDIRVRPPENRYIANDFIYCRRGIFDRLDGFDEQLRLGNISDYRLLRPRGWSFSGTIASSTDRVAGFTVQADTLAEFNRKHGEFVRSVRVLDPDGRDIMRHDLLPDLAE